MKSSIWEAVGTLLVAALTINGCVHSCQKHKDDPSWLQDTPAVMYRGVEFFWHDDFAGVNWTDRIKDDVETATKLIDYSNTKESIDDIKMQTESFSNKISKYPIDKKRQIEQGVRLYINWYRNVKIDMENYTEQAMKGDVNKFAFSKNTDIIGDSLSSIYNLVEINHSRHYLDSVINNSLYKESNDSAKYGRLTEFKVFLDNTWAQNELEMESIYSKIFKDKFEN